MLPPSCRTWLGSLFLGLSGLSQATNHCLVSEPTTLRSHKMKGLDVSGRESGTTNVAIVGSAVRLVAVEDDGVKNGQRRLRPTTTTSASSSQQ